MSTPESTQEQALRNELAEISARLNAYAYRQETKLIDHYLKHERHLTTHSPNHDGRD